MENYLGLKWHERATEERPRADYRKGFYERDYVTSLGVGWRVDEGAGRGDLSCGSPAPKADEGAFLLSAAVLDLPAVGRRQPNPPSLP